MANSETKWERYRQCRNARRIAQEAERRQAHPEYRKRRKEYAH